MIGPRVIAIAPVALLIVVGCADQEDAPRDAGGAFMQLTEWTPIDPKYIAVRIEALESVTVTKAEEQIRDNTAAHQRIRFDGRKGYMFIQRQLDGFYHMSAKESVLDENYFKERIEITFKDKIPRLENVKKISASSHEDNGYAAKITFQNSQAECFCAITGYKFNGVDYDNDWGQFDTVVEFVFCDPPFTFERFTKFLGELSLAGKR